MNSCRINIQTVFFACAGFTGTLQVTLVKEKSKKSVTKQVIDSLFDHSGLIHRRMAIWEHLYPDRHSPLESKCSSLLFINLTNFFFFFFAISSSQNISKFIL